MDLSDQLRAAEGYIDLGMSDEAWVILGQLEPIDQVMPDAIALKVRVCTARETWEIGTGLASVLACALAREHRLIAARFRHAYARSLCEKGFTVLAREQVRLAVEASKEIRLEILDDMVLEPIWQ